LEPPVTTMFFPTKFHLFGELIPELIPDVENADNLDKLKP
jgi:hypothetical protein